jgi:betaine-homocysteine S-methyltransferase
MKKNFLEMLKQGVVLGDGGMIIETRWRGYEAPEVIVEHPEVLRQIHADFFRAGSQVLQTLTWWTGRHSLEADNWGNRMEEFNRTAVRLAKEACGGEALVAGCLISDSVRRQNKAGIWTDVPRFDPNDAASVDAARAGWEEQMAILVDEGVDLLIPEGFSLLDEARLCLSCCKKTNLPTMVLLGGLGERNKTRDGVSPGESARILVDEGADVVGTVCGGDPGDMWPAVLEMRRAVDASIACQPRGYRTVGPNWSAIRESMLVSGGEMAEYALRAKAEGINYIGACCGAGPSHIRAMAQALGCERYPV